MKKQNTNLNTTEATVINPFEGLSAVNTTQAGTRKLAYTGVLQEKARSLTTELIRKAGGDAELAPLANTMLADKTPESLLAFITKGIPSEQMTEASKVLDGCPDDDLPKMLESQRSNRSKAKRTGLVAMPKVIDYVASMIGELLIRERTGKAYASTGKLETDHAVLAADQDQLLKRINSLASYVSRQRKLAVYDADAKAKLEAAEAELRELRALRPSKTKTVVREPLSLTDLRAAIATMSEEERKNLIDLMQQSAG